MMKGEKKKGKKKKRKEKREINKGKNSTKSGGENMNFGESIYPCSGVYNILEKGQMPRSLVCYKRYLRGGLMF